MTQIMVAVALLVTQGYSLLSYEKRIGNNLINVWFKFCANGVPITGTIWFAWLTLQEIIQKDLASAIPPAILAISSILGWIGIRHANLPDASRSPRLMQSLVAGTILLTLGVFVHESFSVGFEIAKMRKEYMILSTPPNTAVLRIFGDHAVVASFNPETKILTPERVVTDVKEGLRVGFHWEEVGPLIPHDLALK